MLQGQRNDRLTEQHERAGDFPGGEAGAVTRFHLVFEDITEGAAQIGQRLGGAENRDGGFLGAAERSEIVDAVDVIGVGVGEKNGVNSSYNFV